MKNSFDTCEFCCSTQFGLNFWVLFKFYAKCLFESAMECLENAEDKCSALRVCSNWNALAGEIENLIVT